MNRDKKCSLIARQIPDDCIYQRITNLEAGWELLNFEARILKRDEQWVHNTGRHEMLIVLMGGNFSVQSDSGSWKTVNGRRDVFSGFPHGLYLPPNTTFTLTADSEILDIACSWVVSDQHYSAQFITPDDVEKNGD